MSFYGRNLEGIGTGNLERRAKKYGRDIDMQSIIDSEQDELFTPLGSYEPLPSNIDDEEDLIFAEYDSETLKNNQGPNGNMGKNSNESGETISGGGIDPDVQKIYDEFERLLDELFDRQNESESFEPVNEDEVRGRHR